MTPSEIRAGFLSFFEERGHKVWASSPLIPNDDPTLLFANAGMNQFKDIFLGQRVPDVRRAVSSQKCIRAGGKHNDLEDVGKDETHHTFFEMLGNWSFGDYYKAEAIEWAWDYLTEVVGLPAKDLRATVHDSDDEAEELWLKITGMPKEHVTRHGDKDNFWEMAEVGPCGPCSEIHLDQGAGRGCGRPDCGPNCDHCEAVHDYRFIELWNLVFMQYYRDENRELSPLPETHVDTGMGFERLCAVVEGVKSNYHTELFLPIIRATQELCGRQYTYEDEDAPFRIIADHIRALSLAITDGGFPSNNGRGYVLRRILRRGSRAGRQLGLTTPFMYKLVGSVIETMGGAYPELVERREHVEGVIRREEEQFGRTLHHGIDEFEKMAADLAKTNADTVPGDLAFRLYDTYGVPIDLTALMAEEKGMEIDMAGFETSMEEQRKRSRAQTKFDQTIIHVEDGLESEFVGYDTVETGALIIGSDKGVLVLDQTPFYAESGGQVGDHGAITADGFRFEVTDTQKQGTAILHLGELKSGTIEHGTQVTATVASDWRDPTISNHSATHLMHSALRTVLGEHVHQAGSQVTPERLRFDFTHNQALTPDEIAEIERLVNENVRMNHSVDTTFSDIDTAREQGAMALFGEKYDDIVRVISIGEWSKELCGGTHVRATGQIGLFRVVSESAIAAGTRRIEAITGKGAEELARGEHERLVELGHMLKANPDEVIDRVSALSDRVKDLERELQNVRQQMASKSMDAVMSGGGDAGPAITEIAGSKLVIQEMALEDTKAFRGIGDTVRDKLGSGVGVILNSVDGNVAYMVVVTDDLVEKGVKAGDLIKEVSAIMGGKGGGRPHMAQAGGGNASKIAELREKAPGIVEKALA
jgi:alanyl-tRNA synthetase